MAIMTFGGHEIGDRFLQFNPDRGVLSEVENTTFQVGTADGERFSRSRLKMRVIPVEYDVFTLSKREFERRMAPLLYSTELQELSFSDRKDEYWLAKVDGKIDLDRAFLMGHGTINFIVPDGVSHSKRVSSVDLSSGEPVTVINRGTAPTAPVLTATMADDNGLVAWVNERGGVLQFGNPDEIDGVQHNDNEIGFASALASEPSGVTYNNGTILYKQYKYGSTPKDNKQSGSFDYKIHPDAATPLGSRGKNDPWIGPTMNGKFKQNTLKNNAGNFVWKNRFFVGANVAVVGRLEFNLTDAGEVKMSFVIRDSTWAGDSLAAEFWVDGQVMWSQELNRKQFPNGAYELRMSRFGEEVGFQLARILKISSAGIATTGALAKSFTLEGADTMPVSGFTVWMAGFADKKGWTAYWSDTSFVWANVQYYQDMPNRFKAGDSLVADVATKKVYVNGVEDNTLHLVGNEWDSFVLPSGESRISALSSEWAKGFQSKIEFREAWL